MKQSLLYFDTDHAITVHDTILNESGGRPGIIDQGRLDSILDHLQNDAYYPEFTDKLCHLVFQVNKGHCFNDGNKRTSIALGAFFLELNGLSGLSDTFIQRMENIAVDVADNRIDKDLLKEIIHSILTEPTYNESLQLKIIQALDAGLAPDQLSDPLTDYSAF